MSLPTALMQRARRLDPRWLDAGLAAALCVWALTESRAQDHAERAPVLLAMTIAIAWRRRAPVVVLAVEVAGVVLLTNDLGWPEGVAALIAIYSAALYSNKQVPVLVLLLLAAVALVAIGRPVTIPNALVPLVLLAPPWLAGNAMRIGELRAEALAARAARLELEQEAAVHAERARIARELHDVVTHSVSVMVLQTGAARQIMPKDEGRSRALLESVEASGRQALDELRRMLGVLAEQGGDAPLSPQPDVTQLSSLIEQMHQAGMAVELSVEGEPRAISAGVSVAAYRIVQEALTNVLKHAHGAPSRVLLRWTDDALEVEIVDQGPMQNGADGDAPAGRGLAGMRERAAMYGGTLDAHPGLDRGYMVRATIPLDPEGL